MLTFSSRNSFLITFSQSVFQNVSLLNEATERRSPPPKPGAPPRTIIARLLNYRDRDAILQTARQKGDIRLENFTVHFFPDFTLKVQQERQSFDGIKKTLRDRGIKYMMFYPAKLKILLDGKSWFFMDPLLVQSWLDEHDPRNETGSPKGSWRETRQSSPVSSTGHREAASDRNRRQRDRSQSPSSIHTE